MLMHAMKFVVIVALGYGILVGTVEWNRQNVLETCVCVCVCAHVHVTLRHLFSDLDVD